MNIKKLLPIAVVILLLLVVITLVFSGKSGTKTESQIAQSTPEPTAQFNNINTFPTTSDQVQSTFPGNWYTHKNLVFKLPLSWKVSTGSSTDSTVLAQPNSAADIYSLPRIQISIDDTTGADYIKPDVRYDGYSNDNTTFATYQNIDFAYRTPDGFDYPDGAGKMRKIQERVVILRRNDQDYRVIFQYESNAAKDQSETLFENIIGSLHYQ